MKKIEKLFGNINLTWKKLIIFAFISGIYTAIMALLPITKDTSFEDITISFEVWILFGILIIMNSKSNKDSAIKCFMFFLISQPLVYLLQVPFSSLGWKIFTYYDYWFIWTIITIPMGFIGFHLKKNKWWGLLILIPMLLFLGEHYYTYLRDTIYYFPHHLLSTLFCLVTLILYGIGIFKTKKLKIITTSISICIIIIATILAFTNKLVYKPTLFMSGNYITFDNTYKVYIENNKLGKVYIKYNEGLEDYVITGEFTKAGKTNLIIENNNGEKQIYNINIKYDTYEINKEK